MANEKTITSWCPNCASELTVTVGLQSPVLGDGPIDYVEVVGPDPDRCPECGVILPPEFYADAGEEALEQEREHASRSIQGLFR